MQIAVVITPTIEDFEMQAISTHKIRFLSYLLSQLGVVVSVIILFKVISDPKIAASWAGTLFCLLPLGMLVVEYRKSGFNHKMWIVAVLQFLLIFALPMLSIRLINWQTDFNEIVIWGLPGPLFHRFSHWSFGLMIFATGIMYFRQK